MASASLSLLPLREAEGEMPPTLEWERRYHAPCARAWKHLVEKSAAVSGGYVL